ncbi:GNAT family N-acetyltransferase [Natronoarchaeum rubrum]|uniref:GNAT family N-acetyltransferase n=1 Tax=Natronoarchaeum rubrum TaxID=755311 RepID=UPI00211118E1|nr:GNAT family N-acetyltransferase [Natronoarchaeum rubrum]
MDSAPLDADVRPATADDRLAVRRLLDAAVLAVDDVDERLAAGDVLVAVADGRVVGTVVLSPRESRGVRVAAIAVRRRRRGRGVGTALIERARENHGRLTAEFDADVRAFYESLGFTIEPATDENERFEGVLE